MAAHRTADNRIAENVARVRASIAAAALRSGRQPDDVTLVAVTKYVSAEETAAVVAAGCLDLGEARPQQLWSKNAELAHLPIRWHLVGHLQRNKIRRTLPLLSLLQSVDSRRLLDALAEEAAIAQRRLPILLEVNISGDATKTGLPPAELEPLLAHALTLPQIEVRGLMGMASLEGDDAAARQDFRNLRLLRDQLAATFTGQCTLLELSMGMSGDFEIAIEEGATMVRVGSLLFE